MTAVEIKQVKRFAPAFDQRPLVQHRFSVTTIQSKYTHDRLRTVAPFAQPMGVSCLFTWVNACALGSAPMYLLISHNTAVR
jgi:hypothetical protein